MPLVTHLDGHDSRAARPDWSKWRHAELHSCTEEEAEVEEAQLVHGWLDGVEPKGRAEAAATRGRRDSAEHALSDVARDLP